MIYDNTIFNADCFEVMKNIKDKVFASATISGTPEEIEKLKKIAKSKGKSVSRYILDTI